MNTCEEQYPTQEELEAEEAEYLRAIEECAANGGHQWGTRHEIVNDPFNGDPDLPGGVVGWYKTCARCGYQTGRGAY